MSRVIASIFLTADGVMEAPHTWSSQFWRDDTGQFKLDELFASDRLLLGRVTYDGFAAAWPSMTDEQGFADRMNSLPKYVVSTTLTNPEWNNSHVISASVVEEIAKLKQQPGQDILVYGSAALVNSLIPHGLIDEIRLMIFPIVVGTGKHLFNEGTNVTLKLTDSKTFDSGVVVLSYEPARPAV